MNDEFKNIIRNALNDKMVSIQDKTVASADGISLRLRNIKPELSEKYIDALREDGIPVDIPVVLARGLHSNLSTWEVLGIELANSGRDVWLIEITGGPGQDCNECVDYTFDDLTDDYWPALINGVLSFTGSDKLQYVGHSNGGRVGVVSLQNGRVDTNKIETFIGVGVPGAFEGYSTFGEYFGKYGGQIMDELSDKKHITLTEIRLLLEDLCNLDISCRFLSKGLSSNNKMAFNVDKQYYFWIINNTDEQIGDNLNINNFYLIEGWVAYKQEDDSDTRIKGKTHDFIVTEDDEKALFENILSANKKHYKVYGAHTADWGELSLPDRTFTKSIIKDIVNKRQLETYNSNEVK